MAAAASIPPTLVSLGDDVIVWEYESDIPGLFCGYKDKVSNFMENKYQNKKTSVKLGDIDPALYMFEIDFHTMQQLNQYGMTFIIFYHILVIIFICYINYGY